MSVWITSRVVGALLAHIEAPCDLLQTTASHELMNLGRVGMVFNEDLDIMDGCALFVMHF